MRSLNLDLSGSSNSVCRRSGDVDGTWPAPLYRALLDQVGEAVALLDVQGQYVEQNRAHRMLLGYDDEELRGQSPALHLGEGRFAEILSRLSAGETCQVAVTSRTKGGTVLGGTLSGFTVRDLDGRPIGHVLAQAGMSPRGTGASNGCGGCGDGVTGEPSKTAGRAALLSFVEHTPAAVAILDTDLRYLAASRRWLDDYKLGHRNIIGKHHYDVFPEIWSLPAWQETHRRCLAGAVEICDGELFPRKDGTREWIRWEVRPWYGEEGAVSGIVMFTEVLTDHRRAQEAVRESEERYRSIFESAPDALLVISYDGTIRDVNPAASKLYGYSREEFLGLSCQHIVHPDSYAHVEQAAGAAAEGCTFDSECVDQKKDGTLFPVEVRTSPFRYRGEPVMLSAVRDINERKRGEQLLRDNEDRYARATAAGRVGVWEYDLLSGRYQGDANLKSLFGY